MANPNIGMVRRFTLEKALIGMYGNWVNEAKSSDGPWVHLYAVPWTWTPDGSTDGLEAIGTDIFPTAALPVPGGVRYDPTTQEAILFFPVMTYRRSTPLLQTPVRGWFISKEEILLAPITRFSVFAGGEFDGGPVDVVGRGFLDVQINVSARNSKLWT